MRNRFAGGLAALAGCVLALDAAAQVQTETESTGTILVQNFAYTGQRNDAYLTRLTGSVDGFEFLFDASFFRAFDDPLTQAGLAELTGPRGVDAHGAPGVLTWDAPVLVDSYEEFVDSLTEVYIVVDPVTTVTTVQTTDGDAANAIVFFGDRGTCYDTGLSGATNTPPFDGAFASCDSGLEQLLDAGTTNTNTHVTTIVSTTEVTFTQEDWLNVSHWNFTGHVTLVGHAYPALQSAWFDAGRGFGDRLRASGGLALGRAHAGGAWQAWGQAHRATARGAASSGAQPHRREADGGTVGVDYAGEGPWRVGLALDRTDLEVQVHGAPEHARGGLVQGGVRVGYDAGAWFADATLIHGRGDATLAHGDAGLGGVSDADLDIALSGAGLRIVWRNDLGILRLDPQAGYEWTRQRADEWIESGGIALRSDGYSATRQAAWLGLEMTRTFEFGDGRGLSLSVMARAHTVLSGRGRSVPVAFVADADTPLRIAGTPEARHGVSMEAGTSWRLTRRAVLGAGAQGWWAGDDRGRRWFAALRVDF